MNGLLTGKQRETDARSEVSMVYRATTTVHGFVSSPAIAKGYFRGHMACALVCYTRHTYCKIPKHIAIQGETPAPVSPGGRPE